MEKKKNNKKILTILLLPFIFAVWILIKLGDLTIRTLFRIILFPQKIFLLLPKKQPKKKYYSLALKKISKQKRNTAAADKEFKILFLRFKRHRGRPRTQALYLFWFKKFKRFLNFIFPKPLRIAVFLSAILIFFFAYSFFLIVLAHDLPSPQYIIQNPGPQTTEFYDRNGKLLYRLYEGKNRTAVKLDDLPSYLIQATIAIEDKNFYAHSGVDLYGVARAFLALIQNHQIQGGSTLTQQLIKNTLLTPERTFTRKAKEVILAFWAERIFTKNEILQMYFNEVPFGGPAWGIEAAAQTYFGKKPSKLTLAESAYLAGLPVSPTTYSPYGTNPELGKQRQKDVLRRMVEEGFTSQEEADKAYLEELDIKPHLDQIRAPHFVMYVRSVLSEKYGERAVSQGGLKVNTTLDLDLQEMAENVVSEEVAKLGNLNVTNGAAMITDAKTGFVLAMVGSKNYWDSNGGNFNVTTAERQPGSSIKPVTYATAFKLGYSPGTVLLDTPVTFANAWERYSPVNYDGRYHGPVSIRTALGSSYNIPAVKMLAVVGVPAMIQTARDLGITTFNDTDRYGLSLTLGAGEVKMVDMMSVYGTFSQMGIRHDSQPVLKVVDPTGLVIEDNSSDPGRRVLSSGAAYMITDILADSKARAPAFGTRSLLEISGHTVAVKTGTTDSKRDNWTFGYTPEYVVGVWVGNNNNAPMNQALASGVTGAAPIWNKIMTNLLKGTPDVAFNKPDDVITGTVDGHKDMVLVGTQQKTLVGQNKKQIKDEKTDQPKDVITFTDPFSTFQSDQSGQPVGP